MTSQVITQLIHYSWGIYISRSILILVLLFIFWTSHTLAKNRRRERYLTVF